MPRVLKAIMMVAAACSLIAIAGPSTMQAGDEEPTVWKWVDSFGDCVSTCDSTKYECPCRIG